MKKHSKKVKKDTNVSLKYLLPVLIFFLLLLGAVTVVQNQHSTRVLGEQTGQRENKEGTETKEQVEQVEPTEAPEPTETPEQEQEHEQEAEKAHNEVKSEVQKGTVEKVEINPTSQKTGEGTVKLENTDGTTTEKVAPASTNASLIEVQNPQAGTVAIHVNKDGTATLVNNGVTVTTSYPVVIDPKSQTVAIRTPSGVTVINTLPSQALDGVGVADKPTTIQSAVLGAQDGQAYYEVTGTQKRKFLGIVPVTANVQTKINVDNGSVVSINRPWFLNFLGFLYTT